MSTRTSKRRPSLSGAAISIVRSGTMVATSTSSAGAARGSGVGVVLPAGSSATRMWIERVTRPLGRPLKEKDAVINGSSVSTGAATTATRKVARSESGLLGASWIRRIGASVMRK